MELLHPPEENLHFVQVIPCFLGILIVVAEVINVGRLPVTNHQLGRAVPEDFYAVGFISFQKQRGGDGVPPSM